MSADLEDPRFTDETAAREALETLVWPNGPVCPRCGNADQVRIAALTTKSARPGLRYCDECKGQFKRGFGHKNAVFTLVERGGSARSFHVEDATKETIIPIICENIDRELPVMTNEANRYSKL